MHTLNLRRTFMALLAALSLSLFMASMSHAQAVGGGSGSAAGCKLPGSGKTIDSGSTGTDSDGKVYSCTNGTGCQVEGGKVTDKCSHMSRLIGYNSPIQRGTWTLQMIG